MRMFFLLLALSSAGLFAQPTAEEAIDQVFGILSGRDTASLPADARAALQKNAWEALAYLPISPSGESRVEDLQEAVPDYYRFIGDQLLLKLIDPEDHNRYGSEFTVNYRLKKRELTLLDPRTGAQRDQWVVLYLDAEYLALEMGDLRLFFTRTAAQE